MPMCRDRAGGVPHRRKSRPRWPRKGRKGETPPRQPAERRRYRRWSGWVSRRAVLIGAVFADRFFGVGDRGRNHVGAAGPLAEIDKATALAAEREVGVGGLYRLLADRAAEFDGAFARHSRIAETFLASNSPW